MEILDQDSRDHRPETLKDLCQCFDRFRPDLFGLWEGARV